MTKVRLDYPSPLLASAEATKGAGGRELLSVSCAFVGLSRPVYCTLIDHKDSCVSCLSCKCAPRSQAVTTAHPLRPSSLNSHSSRVELSQSKAVLSLEYQLTPPHPHSVTEPVTSGRVLLKTSLGDIVVELWPREAPKAVRNFVQLCLEGYYDGLPFHRVVPGFIAQTGDDSGTGGGGESIYDEGEFEDEFTQVYSALSALMSQ